MKQLFVSYAREDHSRVERLVEYLRGAGFDVFWDQSMPAGVVWADFLEAQLSTAHRLVVLWTVSSVGSRWVRTEADEAMQQNKLLPVLLDDVRPPLAFRQIHCFDLIGWQGDADDSRLARLAGELHGAAEGVDGESGSLLPSPAPPAPAPGWPRPLLIGAASVALLWLAFEGWQRGTAPSAGNSPGGGAASVSADPASMPASAPRKEPALSASARRCASIQEQVALGNPISPTDRAFLKAGCR